MAKGIKVSKRELGFTVQLAFDVGHLAGVNRTPRKELRVVKRSAVERLVVELITDEFRSKCTERKTRGRLGRDSN